MDDEEHKKNILETARELLHEVDSFPLHSKNKILLYKSYILSKLSWDFTISDISVTWVKTNIDMKVDEYFCRWLEIQISGTLNICMLSKSKFGLNVIDPSRKFIQCKTIYRNLLKNSKHEGTRVIHEMTSHTNIQYDRLNSTREIVKSMR